MKHRILYLLLTMPALVLGLAACEHDPELEEPHLPPVVSINFASPLEGAVYHNGDTVTIDAVAISTEDLHGYTVSISPANDSTITYFLEEEHAHGDTVLIHHQWKDTLTTPASLEARITVVVDHDGNTLTRKVGFMAQ